MKQIHEVVADLEYASRQGQLTPSYLEIYAEKHGERVTALYALAARNLIAISHEAGRNDHVLTPWEGTVDPAAVIAASEKNSRAMLRKVRAAKDDPRPLSLRKPTRYANFRFKRDEC